VDEQLVDASGKMMVLERLLDELFARGHKVLVFSQFVTMLNVIEVRTITFASFTYSFMMTMPNCRTGRASLSTGHCAA
jgi:hypothetical protein